MKRVSVTRLRVWFILWNDALFPGGVTTWEFKVAISERRITAMRDHGIDGSEE
jgi:hypothetical protein